MHIHFRHVIINKMHQRGAPAPLHTYGQKYEDTALVKTHYSKPTGRNTLSTFIFPTCCAEVTEKYAAVGMQVTRPPRGGHEDPVAHCTAEPPNLYR